MQRTVLVTGASSGIGRATALSFLDAGWRVGVLARRAEVLADLCTGRDNALALPADVTDPAAVQGAFRAFVDWAGRLDVLFNNAGIFVPARPIDEVPLSDWTASVSVNLTGMFLCAQAAFGIMRHQDPQGGRIINNGSLSAHAPREGAVCYTTTKHAITGLTKQISLDGRDFGIACGQIDIGNAKTELLESIAAAAQEKDPDAPVPPMMAVEDTARAVVHMASLPPEANVQFMTVMATMMPYIGRG